MSGGTRPPHAVLARDPAAFAPMKVAAVLAKRAKAPVLDFAASAARAWGVIAEALPAAEAEALAAELTAAGQAALAAPTSLLETPPPAAAVTKAELTGDGFDLVEGRANAAPERLSWTRLNALCAASTETRAISAAAGGPDPRAAAERAVRLGLTLVTGLPLMKGGKTEAKKTVETRDRALTLDLLFVEPSRRLRVAAAAFDYSVLGPKMGYGAEANFTALIAELAARAPRARLGRGALALTGKRPALDARYESLEDLEREERWLLTLAALKV